MSILNSIQHENLKSQNRQSHHLNGQNTELQIMRLHTKQTGECFHSPHTLT